MTENIRSSGYVLKKEKLASMALDRAFTELLLVSFDPYPGLHEEYFLPTSGKDKKTGSVFIVVRNFDACHEDELIRITMDIKREHQIHFDIALSVVHVFKEPVFAIRVHMEDYGRLHELISLYRKAGVNFQSNRKVNPTLSLIKIRRFFDLENIEDGIYKDCDRRHTYYFKLPSFLTWDQFETTTIDIRNNSGYKTYDVAQAAIYDKSGIAEFVRVYDPGTDLEGLQLLRQKYHTEIQSR